MQVKKFEAPTMQEALNLVKTELGPEAIILSTKNHRKGFGLLSKASVEVTAAVSDKSLQKKTLTERLLPPGQREQVAGLGAGKQAEIYEEFTDHYKKRRDEREAREAKAQSRAQQQAQQPAPRMPDRSGLDALMNPQPGSQSTRVAGGGGAFAASNSAPKGNAKEARPPRYIDITDDDDETTQAGATGYSRNGRVAQQAERAAERMSPEARRGVHADADSERMARAAEEAAYRRQQQQRSEAAAAAAAQPAQALSSDDAGAIRALQDDIQYLKGMLEELKSEQVAASSARIPDVASEAAQAEYNNLLRNGIDKKFATPLIRQIAQDKPAQLTEAIAVEMMNSLKIEHPLDFKAGSGQRVFALIGPTGVGKTTTIAKLASQAILQKNLRVGLINVDSYKVAAVDQLATYAKILNVPFRQATNAAELDRALTEFKPLDLVLIDTSGRSQRDSGSLAEMKQLLSECTAARTLLILSATTRDQELYDIVTRFKLFNPSGLLFSKLDETSTFGCIYNVSVKTGLPLTYFTVGQRVPEDIEPASRERVADLILDL
ncbi:MAG: hypothetical protein HY075_09945 [Deltaproteobacteria bacterium]|nr:hypothetical protein [Deltaproteobacteria bacterium]